jgi:protoheme IX farnesyltransferase
MHESSLPTLAPTSRAVPLFAFVALALLTMTPVLPISATLIASCMLFAMIVAWVYTAPLRWPSVIAAVACVPLVLWPDLPIGRIAVLLSASYLLVVSLIPTPTAQHLGGKRAQARQRHSILLAGTVAVLAFVDVVGLLGTSGCTTLPLCGENSLFAQLQNSHRIYTIIAGILAAMTIVATVRTFPTRLPRILSFGLAALIGIQVVVGMLTTQGWQLSATHNLLSALSLLTASLLLFGTRRLPWPAQAVDPVASAPVGDDIVGPYTWREKLKDYVSLTKPGVISLLILTTITSMYITPAGKPTLALVLWTAVGGWLMAAASHAFNCYLDRDIDVLMGRTGRRPIPSGRIPGWHAIVLGVVLMVAATLILGLMANWLTAALAFAGLIYYVFIYTMWLKRSSFNNIVIGGGAGAFPPLVGWAAATGSLTLPSLFLFAIIFYWTPPHFWALAIIRSKDYARAGVPMLPVVAGDDETRRQIVLYTILMFIVTIMPTPLQMLGMAYLVMASVLGIIFAYYAVRLYQQGTTQSAWGLYRYSLLYLALLFGAMVIDRVYFV